MFICKDKKGFSLIEILIAITIISILAGIAVTSYIGIRGRARTAQIIHTASTAKSDIYNWLHSSRSPQTAGRLVDTDFNGVVNVDDKTNGELFNNVDTLYVSGRNTGLSEVSPWFNVPLWNVSPVPIAGTISMNQVSGSTVNVIATEKTGQVVAQYLVSSQ